MNVAVVWPSAGADTTPSGMSLDQPLAARKPLTMCEKYGQLSAHDLELQHHQVDADQFDGSHQLCG